MSHSYHNADPDTATSVAGEYDIRLGLAPATEAAKIQVTEALARHEVELLGDSMADPSAVMLIPDSKHHIWPLFPCRFRVFIPRLQVRLFRRPH